VTEIADAPVSGAVRRAFRLHHHVLIVGGGTAGITVAARLRRAIGGAALGVIEPSAEHYYQPLWTLVGGGVVQSAALAEAGWSKGCDVGAGRGGKLGPGQRVVTGRADLHDFLVVAPGIQLDWGGVAGLEEGLGRDGVCSIYDYENVDRTWNFIRGFQGGTAIFTYPNTPIKCPGAAQKIMYLADDTFRRNGVRGRSRVIYASAAPSIYAVEKYARTLARVVERRGIETRFRHNLVEIQPESRQAVFGSSTRVSASSSVRLLAWRRRRAHPTSSSGARSGAPGWRSTSTPSSTTAGRTCSRSATSPACPRRRPGLPSGHRRRPPREGAGTRGRKASAEARPSTSRRCGRPSGRGSRSSR
jgi:hypothetical protein